jgi:hypothetical protein
MSCPNRRRTSLNVTTRHIPRCTAPHHATSEGMDQMYKLRGYPMDHELRPGRKHVPDLNRRPVLLPSAE